MPRFRSVVRIAPASLLVLLAACSRPQDTAGAASAATSGACTPTVHDAWIRLVPGDDMPMDAGYAVIDNACATPAVITGASSDAYADVSVHESAMHDGMSQMRPVQSLPIAPHGRIELKPGGFHLMLMAPRARPTVGQRVAIRFALQDGRSATGTFEARPVSAQ